MTHRYPALLSSLLLISLVAFACNGDDGTTTSTPTATASTSPTSSPTTPPTTSATPTGTATPSVTASPPETPTATPTVGEAPLFDPALAEAVAHAAVLQPNALDAFGSGWVVAERDVFDDRPAAETFDPTVPECAGVIEIFDAADQLSDASRAGRAQRKLAQDAGTPDEITVEGSVNVFNDVETPTTVLGEFARGFGDTEFAKCFEGTLANGSAAGTAIAVRVVPPTNPAPEGGLAVAIELTIDAGVFLFEDYVWRVSNAGLSVSTAGPAGHDGAFAAAAVAAIDAGLARALAGDLSTPTPTEEPTEDPTEEPTEDPTEEPTETPTEIPTTEPGTGVSAALYEADELPGPETWTVTDENEFNAGPLTDLDESSDACAGALEAADEALTRLDTDVAEGASREYSNAPDGSSFGDGVTASVAIRVFDSADGLDDAVTVLDRVIGSDDYRACLEDTIGSDNVVVTFVESSRPAPHDGLALALDITATDASANEIHIEFYWYVADNSVVLVGLASPPDTLTDDVLDAFLEGLHERLDAVLT